MGRRRSSSSRPGRGIDRVSGDRPLTANDLQSFGRSRGAALEWFGSAESLNWPELSFSTAPFLEGDKWSVVAIVSNPSTSSMTGLTLSFNVAQSEKLVVKPVPRIAPGDQMRLLLDL